MSRPTLAEGRKYSSGVILESWRLWEALQEEHAARRISEWRLDSDYFELEESPAIAVVIAQGASIAVDALERLAGSGASRVVRLGTTGGLQPSMSVGDVALPYAAIRGEGTSRCYLPPHVPALAALPLVEALAARLSAHCGTAIAPCIGWTTDGRWVESDAEIREFSALGVSVVDMESAALFSAAMVRSVQAASVSIVADLPILHIGSEFKGLPAGEEEWRLVLRRARAAFAALLDVLRHPESAC
ncbi:MAG TPA: hypothetical protein VFO89_10450 [Thermoanaerobaculia bacterium]|nr:hypothetical protein [Thermoanaerobaculia bacterium]